MESENEFLFEIDDITSDWDTTFFKRIPSDLFEDPIWNNQQFTKKEAMLDLYALAYDALPNTSAPVQVRQSWVRIFPGEVIRGYRALAIKWGWSKKTVGRFLKELEELGIIKIRLKKPCTVIELNFWVHRLSPKGDTTKPEGGHFNNKDNNNNKNIS